MLPQASRPFPPVEPHLQPGRLPEHLVVRTCETHDVAALFALFNADQCQSDFLPEPFPTEATLAEWLKARRVGNYQIVAISDGEVVAFAGLYLFRGRQDHAGFTCIAVRPDRQGRGIGRILFQAVLATADRVAGLTRVELSVLADNERAIALYRKCGFEIEGRHRQFARRGDAFVDALTMARLSHPAVQPAGTFG